MGNRINCLHSLRAYIYGLHHAGDRCVHISWYYDSITDQCMHHTRVQCTRHSSVQWFASRVKVFSFFISCRIRYLWEELISGFTGHTYSPIQHHGDVIMSEMAFQITGVSIVCSSVCSDEDQRKHQSSPSLAFVRGIHRGPSEFPHKGPETRKMFQFDDVTILSHLG